MAMSKEKIENLNGSASLGYKIAAAIGAFLTLVYLMKIQYFPSGLTLGEVIFFVFVALAFGLLCALFLLYGAFSAIWFAQLISHATLTCVFGTFDLRGEGQVASRNSGGSTVCTNQSSPGSWFGWLPDWFGAACG